MPPTPDHRRRTPRRPIRDMAEAIGDDTGLGDPVAPTDEPRRAIDVASTAFALLVIACLSVVAVTATYAYVRHLLR